jgi:hypothetical protein
LSPRLDKLSSTLISDLDSKQNDFLASWRSFA